VNRCADVCSACCERICGLLWGPRSGIQRIRLYLPVPVPRVVRELAVVAAFWYRLLELAGYLWVPVGSGVGVWEMDVHLRVAALQVVRGLGIVLVSGAGCWNWPAICGFLSGLGSGVWGMGVFLGVPVMRGGAGTGGCVGFWCGLLGLVGYLWVPVWAGCRRPGGWTRFCRVLCCGVCGGLRLCWYLGRLGWIDGVSACGCVGGGAASGRCAFICRTLESRRCGSLLLHDYLTQDSRDGGVFAHSRPE